MHKQSLLLAMVWLVAWGGLSACSSSVKSPPRDPAGQSAPSMALLQEQIQAMHQRNQQLVEPERSNAPQDTRFFPFQPLAVEVVCGWSCEGGSAATQRDQVHHAVFDPWVETAGLGDGQLVRSLGMELERFGQVECLRVAQKTCGDLASIYILNLKKIQSGSWSMVFPYRCADRLQLSPYERTAGAALVPRLTPVFNPNSPPLVIQPTVPVVDPVPRTVTGEVRWMDSDAPAPACSQWIQAERCYGDCAYETQKNPMTWSETLDTPKPLGQDRIAVCADPLLVWMRGQHLSASVRALFCENYVWNSLRKVDAIGLSCAAVRLKSIDCSGL